MTLAHLLLRQARQRPDSPAILEGAALHATHGQWAARSAGLASRLREAGLQPGDRVLLFARNHPRYLEVLWGLWWAGLVAVPVNAKLHPREVEWIAANCGARWTFVTSDVAPEPLARIERQIDLESDEAAALLAPVPDPFAVPLAERDLGDTAWLFYTSGTTGRPKGVMLTHRNLMTMGLGYHVDVDPVAQGDAIVYAAPISHGAGIYAIPHLMAGARHVVPASGGVDPAELFALGRAIGPLSLFAAPTIVGRLVDEAEQQALSPADCAQSLKTIVYGGAPMYVADIQRALRVMGPRFVQIYGQGESPMTITALSRVQLADRDHPRWAERMVSVGVAQSLVEVRVVDAAGQPLPPGETGEVLVRGDTVMPGYWNNPEATAKTLQSGWLYTGDMGALDADGFLTLKDRSKDVIISGGENISSLEVEEVLYRHPAVMTAAVVARPDAKWGEVPAAYIEVKEGAGVTAEDIIAHCREHLARFKVPKHIEFCVLPKTSTGKIQKFALREQAKSASAIE